MNNLGSEWGHRYLRWSSICHGEHERLLEVAAWTWTVEHVNGPTESDGLTHSFFPPFCPVPSLYLQMYPSWSINLSNDPSIYLYQYIYIDTHTHTYITCILDLDYCSWFPCWSSILFDCPLIIATPKRYSVDVMLLQDVPKSQLSALCR